MQDVSFRTFTIPPLGRSPVNVARGTNVPQRIEITNVGGVTCFVGPDSGDLTTVPPSPGGTLRIDPGQEKVLVLAPLQPLLAIAVALGTLAVSQSDALPIEAVS
jgi:hypothetical protein